VCVCVCVDSIPGNLTIYYIWPWFFLFGVVSRRHLHVGGLRAGLLRPPRPFNLSISGLSGINSYRAVRFRVSLAYVSVGINYRP